MGNAANHVLSASPPLSPLLMSIWIMALVTATAMPARFKRMKNKQDSPLTLFLKGLPMVTVLILAWVYGGFPDAAPHARWMFAGLILCLGGDIVLGIHFIAGGGLFLLGHVCYVIGLLTRQTLAPVHGILFVSVLVVLVAVVIMTVYARKSSNPLRDMAKTAAAFGHGNLKARAQVPEDAPEEIRDLALAFNNMAHSLEKIEYGRKEFVANVSHELKTPMTTIGGFVDGILDGTIPPQQQKKYLQIVSDETKRLNRLVRSMLDISQMQDGIVPEEKKSRFDITECAGQVLVTFEDKINSKALDVQVNFPAHPVITYACRDYITQVIYNLVDNAVKFCPENGCLGVSVREGSQKVFISISNNGQTIPAQELPLLFERFHKLDKSRSQNRDGWGLGLYIVKTLVCAHGEDISVSSAEGNTEFTFTLPLAN